MKREIKSPMKIEEGLHKGVIIGVEERTQPYNYIDVVLEFKEDDKAKQIKAGYPDFLSTESKLGNLLARFGADISTPGTFIDPEKELIGKKCQFITINQQKEKGTFANVVPESLKPLK